MRVVMVRRRHPPAIHEVEKDHRRHPPRALDRDARVESKARPRIGVAGGPADPERRPLEHALHRLDGKRELVDCDAPCAASRKMNLEIAHLQQQQEQQRCKEDRE